MNWSLFGPGHAMRFLEHPFGPSKCVFADEAKITAHTNPVVADSRGVWPAIYLDGSPYDYDVVIEDPRGNILASISPLSMNCVLFKSSDA